MIDGILVLNAGSSSLKFQVFELATRLSARLRGQIERIGTAPRFVAKNASGSPLASLELSPAEGRDHAACLAFLASWLREKVAGGVSLAAVGHRVSHGGTEYTQPVRVDAQVLSRLEALIPLVPLHQPFNLAPIRSLLDARPELPQVACFDTAFHTSQPQLAQLFGLPKRLYDEGVRRYGFHGLSYEYISQQLKVQAPAIALRRVVVAHLGSGASMCALREGKSVATSFGFSALEGLPMGTRCGSLDPGVVIFLARERGMSFSALETLLYKQSGLLGLSGISNDVRVLLDSPEPDAALALDYFCYRASRELGSLAAALGGLDALVFTAGIGENSAELRARICARASWLGVELEASANQAGQPRISSPQSRVAVWVIPTNEELMIAQHTLSLLK
ncbi:MAG TPA: acetate/propionate family kinase [Polyangiaceae bacterium]|jgi:acetate kinase|nr:acetate/propionate family kinase [Polyangiaceae bacterium]